MDDEGEGASRQPLRAWEAAVDVGKAPDEMRRMVEAASSTGVDVLVCRRDMVFGRDHISSAALHARRAIGEGRNASESLPMETLLYLSGERQLSSAIEKMSVDGDTTLMAVAQLSPGEFPAGPSWKELPRVDKEIGAERLRAFGISAEELDTVGPGREAELVLERVASVDVTKR